MILKVPLDLRPYFLADPESFIRDICCVPVDSILPFFKRRDLISFAFNFDIKNPFDEDRRIFDVDFRCTSPHSPRFLHIDLGLRHDAVGISCCHASSFFQAKILTDTGFVETLVPFITFDFVGRITVDKGEEIILSEIEDIIMELTGRGFYIGLITFDRFQSAGTIQNLRNKGYTCGNLSIDRTAFKVVVDGGSKDNIRKVSTERQYAMAGQELKEAIYRRGISIPYHRVLEEEMKTLEYDAKKGVIKKREGKTDDLFQSVAGSCFNLINNTVYIKSETHEEITSRADTYYVELDNRDVVGRSFLSEKDNSPDDTFYSEL